MTKKTILEEIMKLEEELKCHKDKNNPNREKILKDLAILEEKIDKREN